MSPTAHHVMAAAARKSSSHPVGEAVAPSLKTPLSLRERTLLGVSAAQLIYLPWAFGAMHEGAQWVSLGLAATAFLLALLWRDRFDDSEASRNPWGRLRTFPIFWAGLMVFFYIIVQALNPAWRFASDETSWWLEPTEHIGWLPAGIEAPFARWNSWRALVVWGSAWLLACALWTGLGQRRSWRLLFTMLTVNAFVLAVLGLLQLMSGAKGIFWNVVTPNLSFIATFPYRNHAGAYFNLMAGLSIGLAWWMHRRAHQTSTSSSPAGALAIGAMFSVLAVSFTQSRASIALLGVFIAATAVTAGVRMARSHSVEARRAEFAVLIFALVGLGGMAGAVFGLTKLADRLETLKQEARFRMIAREAATEMWRDRWLLGWGAGSFRHGFPLYAQHHPEIYRSGRDGRPIFWEHAHNDLLQFPLELGVIGMAPLLLALGWAAWRLVRLRFWHRAITACLVGALAFLALHAWVDFVLQNPAVLVTAGALLVGALRWAETEGREPAVVSRRRGARKQT
jgi:O-antigen ligase